MMTSTERTELILPSIRAHMGDWVYYISTMKMKELAGRVSGVPMVYSNENLQNLLQRKVIPERATEIAHYLISQKQHFFNALVIGTFGGDPKWRELSIDDSSQNFSNDLISKYENNIGFLVLDGTEKLFSIDGQHRIEGIRKAIESDAKLNNEDICVILVRGVTAEQRSGDEQGYIRTRRLFTTINRYAKPVNLMSIIALDEDDSVAIITRQLVNEYPLFIGKKITIKPGKNILPYDRYSFTSILTIYNTLDLYRSPGPGWAKFKKFYPGEQTVNSLYKKSTNLWDVYCQHFPELDEVKNASPDAPIAAKYRHKEGGHVLFRPIGMLTYQRVVQRLIHSGVSVKKAIKDISAIPTSLSEFPWDNLFWDSQNKRILFASENQKVAEKWLFYTLGGDLSLIKTKEPTTVESLTSELAGILKISEREVIDKGYIKE